MSDQTLLASENPTFITVNDDGSYTRLLSFPCSPPTPGHDPNTPAISKDVTINDINKTTCRIHIPKETHDEKLPIIVYYRGGGFIFTFANNTMVHEFCDQLATHLRAVVVNVGYRNAPEHRLPAAYDDGVEALHWVKSTQDPWLTKFADLSNCYLMGTSAGANIAYHTALRVSKQLMDLESINIKGLIFHNIFMGGLERTESDIRFATTGANFSLSLSDTMWDFALPVGASRDHEYCNLMMGKPDDITRIKDVGWPFMMAIRNEDFMIDRQVKFAKTLQLRGVECTCFYSDGEHGIEYFDKTKAKELYKEISRFMSSINVKKLEKLSGNQLMIPNELII